MHFPFNQKKKTFLSLESNALNSFGIWPMPNQPPGQLYGLYIPHKNNNLHSYLVQLSSLSQKFLFGIFNFFFIYQRSKIDKSQR